LPERTFTYKASDGVAESSVATVTVQVNPPAPKTYSNASVQSIPDQGTLLSTITISDTFTILDINVRLNITHTRDSDLRVFLKSPSGTTIELFNAVGGSGENFQNTTFDDEATTSITAGAAPFSGTYKPFGSLSGFEPERGRNLDGGNPRLNSSRDGHTE
jgi:hypothetical protein